MPFTPYHFGPSGFIGLTLRKHLDIPVFVLANVIVDIEVPLIRLLETTPQGGAISGYSVHRYAHTLLIGAAVGSIWAVVAYGGLRNLFKKIMQILHIPYQSSLLKMIISGIFAIRAYTKQNKTKGA